MPTRLLSQSINVSDSISKLTPLEEVLFLHLIVSVDDYGRFYGHPDIIRGMLFSRRDFTSKQIEGALKKLEAEGMIRRYTVGNKFYLELTSWMKYQRPRAKTSKFPEYGSTTDIVEQLVEEESMCEQMQTDEIKDESPVLFQLPLNTGEKHDITENAVKEYENLYPAVDVQQEIRAMIGWLQADRKRLKTKTGIKRFIAGWLNRSQNSHNGAKRQPEITETKPISDNPYR